MNDLTQFKHKDYNWYLPIWTMIDDVVKGEKAVKDKGPEYLPVPNPSDKSDDNKARYAEYLRRAYFFGATSRTVKGMVGSIFRKSVLCELMPSYDYIKDDIDGNGIGIEQQAQYVTKETLKKGRCGILVDYPQVDGDITVERARQENLRPYAVVYEAQSIVNWITKRYGAVTKLSTIVLSEEIEMYTGTYQTETIKQYRVLELDEDGLYRQVVYQLDPQEKMSEPMFFEPRDANGNRLNYIPFVFVGAENNDYRVDDSPIYDLAVTNLSHYRNSADNEESTFIVGQPSLFISASNPEQILESNPCGIRIGSRAANFIGDGDTVQLLQAQENNLAMANMSNKENIMIMQGARLITPQVQETAEAARIKKGDDNSILAIIVRNVNDAYSKVIEWLMLFTTGNQEEYLFEIDINLFTEKMTPQDRAAWIADLQQGVVSIVDYRAELRKSGLIADERDDQDIESDIEQTPPSGM